MKGDSLKSLRALIRVKNFGSGSKNFQIGFQNYSCLTIILEAAIVYREIQEEYNLYYISYIKWPVCNTRDDFKVESFRAVNPIPGWRFTQPKLEVTLEFEIALIKF